MLASTSERSNAGKSVSSERRQDESAADEAAIKAVTPILSGYAGRYIKDEDFRMKIRDKYSSCLVTKKKNSDNWILRNMEVGIDSIDSLVRNPGLKIDDLRMEMLSNSIRLFNEVAGLNSKKLKNGSTCGIPNSCLSAFAQFYLSISYKLEKNDQMSARHLLQVFYDSPFLARTHILPDLWEHLFLPHLLYLKIWYDNEAECLLSSGHGKDDRKLKCLSKLYNDRINVATAQYALYYKQWLEVRPTAPLAPDVPLPSRQSLGFSGRVTWQARPTHRLARRKSSDSYMSNSSIGGNTYDAVFGPRLKRRSMDFEFQSKNDEENNFRSEENYSSRRIISNTTLQGASNKHCENHNINLWAIQKLNSFRVFDCQSAPLECLVKGNRISSNNQIKQGATNHQRSDDLGEALCTLCRSNILSECETAIHLISNAWLSSQGEPTTEALVSRAPVIEGMLELLFASEDDEVLELAISLLAEIVIRSKKNAQIVLNSDPQLEIFIRLLKRSSIFLKAAILLYHLKPEAKQMISCEWIVLILRVLEFGDHMQTLFTVHCAPRVAAFYMLNQLIFCFDEDRTLENAREIVSLGGLNILMQWFDKGDFHERRNAAALILCCIQADGSCRNYVAENIEKASLLELIALEYRENSTHALYLLIELLCLSRRSEINKFLYGLKNGWGGLNMMHILEIYLHKALPRKRPLFASVLLQLDLLGDSERCSLYREEALEAITATMDCAMCSENIQETLATSLLMLGGRFSFAGEALTERWLLGKSGFQEYSHAMLHDKDMAFDPRMHPDEEKEETENWLRKAALVLLKNGHRRFLIGLSMCIENGSPVLARAALITVSWMSCFIHLVKDKELQSEAAMILIPHTLKSLKFDRALEERVMASFTLLNLVKSSGCLSMVSSLEEESQRLLQNLALVTWTADDLLSYLSPCARCQVP